MLIQNGENKSVIRADITLIFPNGPEAGEEEWKQCHGTMPMEKMPLAQLQDRPPEKCHRSIMFIPSADRECTNPLTLHAVEISILSM